MYFKTTYFNEKSTPTEVEIICDKCGETISVTNLSDFNKITSDYCIANMNNQIICKCGNQCQSGIIQEKQFLNLKEATIINYSSQQNIPHCPICQSTDLSKISILSKARKIAIFGIFGMGDNGKTWKCNNCGSKF